MVGGSSPSRRTTSASIVQLVESQVSNLVVVSSSLTGRSAFPKPLQGLPNNSLIPTLRGGSRKGLQRLTDVFTMFFLWLAASIFIYPVYNKGYGAAADAMFTIIATVTVLFAALAFNW